MGKAVLRLCSLLMMLMCFADMLKGYDRYVLGFVCPESYTHTQTVESQSPLRVISASDASHAQTGGSPQEYGGPRQSG